MLSAERWMMDLVRLNPPGAESVWTRTQWLPNIQYKLPLHVPCCNLLLLLTALVDVCVGILRDVSCSCQLRWQLLPKRREWDLDRGEHVTAQKKCARIIIAAGLQGATAVSESKSSSNSSKWWQATLYNTVSVCVHRHPTADDVGYIQTINWWSVRLDNPLSI